MERRFKIGYVSDHEVSLHAENFGKALQSKLPEGTQILEQTRDFDSASMKILLFNPNWTITPLGRNLGKLIIELDKPEEKKLKIAYNH